MKTTEFYTSREEGSIILILDLKVVLVDRVLCDISQNWNF